MVNGLEVKLQKAALALVQTFKNQASFKVVVKVITFQTDQAATLREAFLAGFGSAKGWSLDDLGHSASADFLNAVKQVKEEDLK
jgi:hypothetical protein